MISIIFVPAKAEENISFSNIEEAVLFITKCINENDADALFRTCENIPDWENYSEHILERLKDLNQKTPLIELYADEEFPKKENSYTLGGHGFKWGHLHLNFVKKDKKWQLNSIHQCK